MVAVPDAHKAVPAHAGGAHQTALAVRTRGRDGAQNHGCCSARCTGLSTKPWLVSRYVHGLCNNPWCLFCARAGPSRKPWLPVSGRVRLAPGMRRRVHETIVTARSKGEPSIVTGRDCTGWYGLVPPTVPYRLEPATVPHRHEVCGGPIASEWPPVRLRKVRSAVQICTSGWRAVSEQPGVPSGSRLAAADFRRQAVARPTSTLVDSLRNGRLTVMVK